MEKSEKSKKSEALPLPDIEARKKESHDLLISSEQREKAEAEDANIETELAAEKVYKTKQGEGHTHNPHLATQQGLTYTPPSDPPILPSEEAPQGVEVAAGFAPSMEESNPDVERLPNTVDNNDLDLLENIHLVLRNNSETGHLTNVKVQVDQGVVNLLGTVTSQDDIPVVFDLVSTLEWRRCSPK